MLMGISGWAWMALVFGYAMAPLAIVNGIAAQPRVAPWWDWLMAVGLIALGIMAALPLITARYSRTAIDTSYFARLAHQFHQWLSYVVIAFVLLHAIGLIVFDTVLIEYLKLSAPLPMLAGIVAAVILLWVTISSLVRESWYVRYRNWRRWHALLAAAALALTIYHVVAIGYYSGSKAASSSLVAWFLIPTLLSLRAWRQAPPSLRAGGAERIIIPGKPLQLADRVSIIAAMVFTVVCLTSALLFILPVEAELEREVSCENLHCS